MEWTRPLGFWALALPALLILFSLRRARPNPLHLGTMRLWRDLAGQGDGARVRWRLPLSRALLVLGLVAGALALAGPRRAEPHLQTTWHVIVDTRPAMFLEHTDEAGRATGLGTRLDVALAALDELVRSQGSRPSLLWSSRVAGTTRSERLLSDHVPDEFLVAPAGGHARTSWMALDEPHTLWVSDRMPPGPTPQHAGLVLSGGGPVAGALASVGDRSLVLSGGQLVEGPGLARRGVYLSPSLPSQLALFARLWSEQRGFEVLERQGPEEDLALRILVPEGYAGPQAPCTFGRDGWVASAPFVEPHDEPSDAPRWIPWLIAQVDGRERQLVSWQPGRVRVALLDPMEPSSVDPSSFAVSWAELFDRALAPAPGVLSSTERGSAGEALSRAPQSRNSDPGAEPEAWTLARLLATAAAVLVLAAAFTQR